MADCNETIRQLYAYLDEMLDESLKDDIALHLGDCPDCQGRVEFEYSLKIKISTRYNTHYGFILNSMYYIRKGLN